MTLSWTRRRVLTQLIAGGAQFSVCIQAQGQLSRSNYLAVLHHLQTQEQIFYGARDVSFQGQERHRPGSLIKLVTAATALDLGITNPSRRIYCPGWLEIPTSPQLGRLSCWAQGGHGSLTLVEALSQSCNIHFYTLGVELGLKRLVWGLKRFGIPMEFGGTAPLVATGEDPHLQVTTDEVVHLINTVAQRGQGQRPLHLNPQIWDLLHAGMIQTVQAGTGQGLSPPGLSVAAKTGTLYQSLGDKTPPVTINSALFQSWIIAFWPAQEPEWTLTLRLHRGRAYQEGIPIARSLISRR